MPKDAILTLPSLDDYKNSDRPNWHPITAWVDKVVSRVIMSRDADGNRIAADYDGYSELATKIADFIEPHISEDLPWFKDQKHAEAVWRTHCKLRNANDDATMHALQEGTILPDPIEYDVCDFMDELRKLLAHDLRNIYYRASFAWGPHVIHMSQEQFDERLAAFRENGGSADIFGKIALPDPQTCVQANNEKQ